jgi:hypothetical protein
MVLCSWKPALTPSATISRGRLQGNQDAHRGLRPVQHAAQVAHVFHAGLAAFDPNDDFLRLARLRAGAEKNLPVNGAGMKLEGHRRVRWSKS